LGTIACPAGNFYTAIWINALTWVLAVQAVALLFRPSLVTARPARLYAWIWYTLWMFGCSIVLLVGMHYRELISQYSWAFLWLPPIATMATAVATHHQQQQTSTNVGPVSTDLEANPAAAAAVRPPACTKAAWRKCWVDFWAFCAWSSMFWLSFLVSGAQQFTYTAGAAVKSKMPVSISLVVALLQSV
jgi:hypothetical protein